MREGAEIAYDRTNEIPAAMRLRQISLRAFNVDHLMVDADPVLTAARCQPSLRVVC